MTEPFDTLLRVQEHDTALDQLRHGLDVLPERVELDAALRRKARLGEAMEEVRSQVEDLATRQRHLEGQIEEAAHRRHAIEQRMESGTVTASRDLQAMDHEVHQLAERQSRFEEQEIDLLEEEEPLDAALSQHVSASEALDADIERLTSAIAEAERSTRRSIEEEEAGRRLEAAGLPEPLAERYEKLRSRLGGVGAARLVGDRCGGCHLTLSSVDLDRIRHLPPDELVTCTQCDRILVR